VSATALPGATAVHDAHRAGLDVEPTVVEPGCVEARLELRDELAHASGGMLRAGTVVAFAETLAGWGCLASLPDAADGFAPGEVRINLVASAHLPATLTGVALLVHGDDASQTWDVTVAGGTDGRVLAHFRCTQYLLCDCRPAAETARAA
jgi:acyl-coenzyme A thioesterase PaaI-like protein